LSSRRPPHKPQSTNHKPQTSQKTKKRHNPQEAPANAGAVARLSPECRDLLDRMFDVNQETRIGVEGIVAHPWFARPLPAKYEAALETLRREQTGVDRRLAAAALGGAGRARERDAALRDLLDKATRPPGPGEQEGGLRAVVRVPLAKYDPGLPLDLLPPLPDGGGGFAGAGGGGGGGAAVAGGLGAIAESGAGTGAGGATSAAGATPEPPAAVAAVAPVAEAPAYAPPPLAPAPLAAAVEAPAPAPAPAVPELAAAPVTAAAAEAVAMPPPPIVAAAPHHPAPPAAPTA